MKTTFITRSQPVRLACGLSAAVCTFLLSCYESLPPYIEPTVYVKGTAYASYTYTDDNMLTVMISLQNTYDETLQEKATIGGTVRITPHSDPSFGRTIDVRPEFIATPGMYDPATRVLTIDPGEVMWFKITWDLVDARNRSLPDSMFRYLPDPTCSLRNIGRKEVFTVEASVLLFERVGHVSCAPVELSFCYIDAWVDGRLCPGIQAYMACDLIEPWEGVEP